MAAVVFHLRHDEMPDYLSEKGGWPWPALVGWGSGQGWFDAAMDDPAVVTGPSVLQKRWPLIPAQDDKARRSSASVQRPSPLASITCSATTHVVASFQSRLTVSGETFSTSAASFPLSPPKKCSSWFCARNSKRQVHPAQQVLEAWV